jgi:hypothetical protein
MTANPIRVLLALGLLVGKLSLIEAIGATTAGRTSVVGFVIQISFCERFFDV